LNPYSGPGAPPWWPDPNYVREVPRLNAYQNVTTLGYVRIGYCKRPREEVLEDIRAYGRWAADETNTGLFVRGIFFDETPNDYSKPAATYLQEINHEVRIAVGVKGSRLVSPSATSSSAGPLAQLTRRHTGNAQPGHTTRR